MTLWLVLLAFVSGCTVTAAWFEPRLSLARLRITDLEQLLAAGAVQPLLRVVLDPSDAAALHKLHARNPHVAGKRLRSVGEGDTA